VGGQMRAAERVVWGEFPPNGSFLVFKTSKINQHGISRRTTSVQKKL